MTDKLLQYIATFACDLSVQVGSSKKLTARMAGDLCRLRAGQIDLGRIRAFDLCITLHAPPERYSNAMAHRR